MTTFKTFAAIALLTLTALATPSLAHANDRDDRGFDRNQRYNDRFWSQNTSRRDYHSDFRHERDYGRRYGNGYDRNYYYPQPRNVIIVQRATPFDSPVDYRTYSNSRTIIYGDGNRVPLQGGTSYYYYYNNR